MIVFSLCQKCLQPYWLNLQPCDVHLIKQIATHEGMMAPCPRLCGGGINLVGDPGIDALAGDHLKPVMKITGTQLYQAVNGMGLPDEIPYEKNLVTSLLCANRICATVMEEAHGKTYLHELHLSNGYTIHLAAGSRGAHVLKVTKERQHAADSPG